MWYLKHSGGIIYLLNNEYTIGRKNCMINIAQDASISKTHAKFIIKNDKLYVTDCGSTYGTFIQNVKLSPNIEIKIEENATIRLGVYETSFVAKNYPLLVCFSNITLEEKATFIQNMQILKATFSKDWGENCTHLTVGVVKLTSKILLALCNDVPIVTCNFWTEFVQNIRNKKDPPETKDFLPKISESLLVHNTTLEYKKERRTIFNGKIFVFLTKLSMDSISNVVSAAGGKYVLWEKSNITKKDLLGTKPLYLMIEENSRNYSQSSQTTQSFFEAVKILQSNGKRSIPFQEIALAVLYCSCSENCNPDFSRKNILRVNSQSSQSQSIVFATNTETQSTQQHLTTQSSIPDSRAIPSTSSEIPESIPESNISLYAPEYQVDNSVKKIIKESPKSVNTNVSKFTTEKGAEAEINPFRFAKEQKEKQERMEKEKLEKEQEKKKRLAEAQIAQAAKKIKTEGAKNINPFSNQKTITSMFSKPSNSTTVASKNDDNCPSSNETSSTTSEHLVVENPFKRKATSELNETRKKTNKEFSENPFTLARKKDRANSTLQSETKKSALNITFSDCMNQTSNINESQRREDISQNPFSLASKRTKDRVNSTLTENQSSNQRTNINQSLESTTMSEIERKIDETRASLSRYLNLGYEVKNGTIIGKTNGVITRESRLCKIEPIIKVEEENEEILAYKKSLKSMKVLICNNIIVRKENSFYGNATGNNTTHNTTGKNFKKFRKVHPKHYQTNIIPREAYTKVVCRAQGVSFD